MFLRNSVQSGVLKQMADAKGPLPPVAFLSHASEDKPTFVEPLARELASRGVRAWLDRWEIQPGDSLVQRLFDEGLSQCDAVVIVVSQHSARKPWVRDELDTATVNRIKRGTRVIPVRLDEVDMPAPLRHLAWINASRDEQSIQTVAARIADTLFGIDHRPVVASRPTYTMRGFESPGLTRADSFLLAEIAKEAVSIGRSTSLSWKPIADSAAAAGMSGDVLKESIASLEEKSIITVERSGGGHILMISLSHHGLGLVIREVEPNFDMVLSAVIARIVNDPPSKNAVTELAASGSTSVLVVGYILDQLEMDGMVRHLKTFEGGSSVTAISPTLKRRVQ